MNTFRRFFLLQATYALIFGLFFLSSCTKDGENKNNAPSITSALPLEGSKGTRVTISGSYFGNNGSTTKVYFNGRQATILSINNETIVCNVPEKAGSGIIKIVTANKDTANGPLFTYKFTGLVTTLAGGLNSGYVDGVGTEAKFGQSNGLCTDDIGNIFMVDYFNNRVRKVTSQGVVSTIAGGFDVAGSTTLYTDGTGSAASFGGPLGIAYAGNNIFYVADTYHSLIRKVTADGVVTTVAGVGDGYSGYVDGNGNIARFYYPAGICVDANKNLYVTDLGNYKIRKITPDGVVTTVAGSTKGYQDGAAATAKFDEPNGICIDAQGNLYVSETGNHRIRKITPSGIVSTLAGSSPGFANGEGATAQFNTPIGICIDKAGNIFVADAGNNQIRMVTPSGLVTTIDMIEAINQHFFSPRGVSIDPNGILYVMDTYLYRVRKVILE